MGILTFHCLSCGGRFEVYSRDEDNPAARQCPHCGKRIEAGTWAVIQAGRAAMNKANLALALDARAHKPQFEVGYKSNAIFENTKKKEKMNNEAL